MEIPSQRPLAEYPARSTGLGLADRDSVKTSPPESNAAYAGVVQDDDPSVMDEIGQQQASELAKRNLAAHIDGIFTANKMLRETNGVDEDLMKRLRQMNGEYDPQDLSEIVAKGQPAVYINLSAHKQRTLVAWLTEFFGNGEKSFFIAPTPVPELEDEIRQQTVQKTMKDWVAMLMDTGKPPPPEAVFEYASMARDRISKEIEEKAKTCAARMDKVIKDDFIEGRWNRSFNEFVNYLATYGTAGKRCPVVRLRKTPVYETTKYGKRVIDKTRIVREFDALSPWDMFPSNGCTNTQEGDFCLRVRYSARELRPLAKLPCYFKDNVQRVLDMYGDSGVSVRVTSDTERDRLEKHDDAAVMNKRIIEGVEFWGQASGEMLISMGITRTPDKNPVDKEEWYEVNAIVVDGTVIYCRVMDGAEERPVSVCCVYEKPGAFWGEGPLHVIDHIQRVCNATSRNLLVNMGFASGPQAYMDDVSRLHPIDDGKARPNKTWAFTNPGNASARPISFFNLPSVAKELIDIFTFYMRLADELTGIPAFANGTDAAVGAARALADYEKVLTPDGSVEISRRNVGDKVLNAYSGVSRVTGVYPQGIRDIFRMRFSNGEHVDCDAEHRWTVSDHPERANSWKTKTTEQLVEDGLFRKTIPGKKNHKGYRPRFALPYVESLAYDHKDVPIEPYTLGALIGNGDKRCRLCVMDQEVFDRIPYKLGVPDGTNSGKATSRTVIGVKRAYHALGLGVGGLEKFIPESYLHNSKNVRLELLRGLMDTDGCCSENGDHVFYSTSSKKLADDFITLVKSLGATSVSLRSEAGGNDVIKGRKITRAVNYRICFNLDHERVFWLERKQSRVHKRPRKRVYITGVDLIGRHSATCITVDSKDSLFLCANFIPTHNTATGLNMLFGAANRGIKKIVSNMDELLKSCVMRLYWWHMRYNRDDSIKGDIRIEVCGVRQFTMRESLAQKHLQLLQMVGQDERIRELQSPQELARMLRDISSGFELDPDCLAPPPDELERRLEAAKQAAQEQMMLAQAEAAAQGGSPQDGEQGGGGVIPPPSQRTEQPRKRPQQPKRVNAGNVNV